MHCRDVVVDIQLIFVNTFPKQQQQAFIPSVPISFLSARVTMAQSHVQFDTTFISHQSRVGPWSPKLASQMVWRGGAGGVVQFLDEAADVPVSVPPRFCVVDDLLCRSSPGFVQFLDEGR